MIGVQTRRLPGVSPAKWGRVAQLVRAPASHAGGHRFESCRAHHSKQKLYANFLLVFVAAWNARDRLRTQSESSAALFSISDFIDSTSHSKGVFSMEFGAQHSYKAMRMAIIAITTSRPAPAKIDVPIVTVKPWTEVPSTLPSMRTDWPTSPGVFDSVTMPVIVS